jgi:hypothetical protein
MTKHCDTRMFFSTYLCFKILQATFNLSTKLVRPHVPIRCSSGYQLIPSQLPKIDSAYYQIKPDMQLSEETKVRSPGLDYIFGLF